MRFITKSFALLATLGGLAAPALAQGTAPFADPSRVAVIGGSLLEIVYALGEEGKIVARDTTGVYPPEAMALPDVGYMRALSPEGVLAVNPTALLVIEGSGPPEALDVLSKGSIPYIAVPEGYSHDGILAKVRAVGAALDVPDKAEALATELDDELKAAEAATADIPDAERKRVLFVISVQDGKIRAAGSGTAANGIIELAGAINPLAAMNGYQTLTDEAILTANPDFVGDDEQWRPRHFARARCQPGPCRHPGAAGGSAGAHGRRVPARLRPAHAAGYPRPPPPHSTATG